MNKAPQEGKILLIFAFLALTAVILIFFIYQNFQKPNQNISSKGKPSPIEEASAYIERVSPVPTPSGFLFSSMVKLSDVWSKGTSKFSDPEVGVSFDYPSYFEYKQIDLAKENKEWAEKYKDDKQITSKPLYPSNMKFLGSFHTPYILPDVNNNQASEEDSFLVCGNQMGFYLSEYDNSKNLSLYDFIAELNSSYPGNGRTEGFEEYKKDLKQISQPKEGSYIFSGVLAENISKQIYFEDKGKIYILGLHGGTCGTGGGFPEHGEEIFDKVLASIKFN